VLNFQGQLVDQNGVPYGTEDGGTTVHMRFTITSVEDGLDYLWRSAPREVLVENGLFSVRLGQYLENEEEPLDESIFTGDDDGTEKRFLHIEISTRGEDGPWHSFLRKDMNEAMEPTVNESQIPISGVPFIVSAVRLVGNDIKEGTLRLSKDPYDTKEDDGSPDLKISAGTNFSGLNIVRGNNIGLVLYQPQNLPLTPGEYSLTAKGSGSIKGGMYLNGEVADLEVQGSLEAYTKGFGRMEVKSSGDKDEAVMAGSVKSPIFRNGGDATDFTVSTVGLSTLHRLNVVDTSATQEAQSKVLSISSNKEAPVLYLNKDSKFHLGKSGVIEFSGKSGSKIEMRPNSKGIQAIGLYDISNTFSDDFRYQLIPHGLSVLGSLAAGGKPIGYDEFKQLIGIYNPNVQDWEKWPGLISEDQFHKHDLRIAADADSLVRKLNEATDMRITKKRLDNKIAYKNEDNFFDNRNYFEKAGWSFATNNRIITRSGSLDIFMGGEKPTETNKRIILGSSKEGVEDFYFYRCTVNFDCTNPSRDYLNLLGGGLSIQGTVKVSDSVDIRGLLRLSGAKNGTSAYATDFGFIHGGISLETVISPRGFVFMVDYKNLSLRSRTGADAMDRSVFRPMPGLYGGGYSFASIKYPDRYLTINPNTFILECIQNDGTEEFKKWSTFKIVSPLVNPMAHPEVTIDDAKSIVLYIDSSRYLSKVNDKVKAVPFSGATDFAANSTFYYRAEAHERASISPDTNDVISYVRGNTRIQNRLILSKGPIINTSMSVSNAITAKKFQDSDQPDFYFDPDGSSKINRMKVYSDFTLDGNFRGLEIKEMQNTRIAGSTTVSKILTAYKVVDSDSSSFWIDPYPDAASSPTKLSRLTLKGDLHIRNSANINQDFIVNSDFYSDNDLTLTNGHLDTKDKIYIHKFVDLNSAEHSSELSRQTQLKYLQLKGNFRTNNVQSLNPGATFNVNGNMRSQSLYSYLTGTFSQLVDANNPAYQVDPNADTLLRQTRAITAKGQGLGVRQNATLMGHTDLSAKLTVGSTLTARDEALHFGDIVIMDGSSKVFHVNTAGVVLKARSLQLEENLKVGDEDSVTYLYSGLNQNGRTGTNFMRNTTFHHNVFLGHSSLSVSTDAFFLTSNGEIFSDGNLYSNRDIIVGRGTLDSTIYSTGTTLVFDSQNNILKFYNNNLDTPLNISAGNVVATSQVISSNVLATPYLVNANGLVIDPNQASTFSVLSIVKNGSNDSGLILSAPLHSIELHDHNNPTYRLNPSNKTRVQTLQIRSGLFKSGALIQSTQNKPVLAVNASSDEHLLFKLDNDRLSLSKGGVFNTSGSMTISSRFFLESTKGMIFSSSPTSATTVTSAVMASLIGQKYTTASNYADHLHQHSRVNSIPLTHFMRRDINNIMAESNTFTATGNALILRPNAASSSKLLFRQEDLNTAGNTMISISDDGVLQAKVFKGEGTYLTHIHGNDIKPSSLTKDDFAKKSLDDTAVDNRTLTADHIRYMSISTNHLVPSTITGRHIQDGTIDSEHINADSIYGADIKTDSFYSRHLGRKSVNSSKISTDTLEEIKVQNLAIVTRHIQNDAVNQDKIADDQLFSYHFKTDSISGNKFLAATLITEDLASNAIGFDEIKPEEITSVLVTNLNVTESKIKDSTVTNTLIVSGTLIQSDFDLNSITLSKIKSYSITSREIKDGTLANQDFRSLNITEEKINDDALRTRHFANNSLDRYHLKDNSVRTRQLANRTITSTQLENLTLTADDFAKDTINPNNLAAKSVDTRHIRDNAITHEKIDPAGISRDRFQPFLFTSGKVRANAVNVAHPMPQSIHSHHIKDGDIQNNDVADNSISGDKIKDYSLLTVNVKDDHLLNRAVNTDAILPHHLQTDSIASIDIDTDVITTDRFKDFNIISRHLMVDTLRTQNFADNAAVSGRFAANSVTSINIRSWSLLTGNFALNIVTSGKITDDTLQTDRFADRTIASSDIGLDQILSSHIFTHAITESQIDTGTLTSSDFWDDVISTDKFFPLTLQNASLATDSVLTSQILSQVIDSRIIKNGTIDTDDMNLNQISTRTLMPLTITSDSITLYSLTSRIIGESQITTDKFKPNGLNTRVFADRNITGDLVAPYSITTDRILNLSIQAARIATGAINSSKLKANIVTSLNVMDNNLVSTKFSNQFLESRVLRDYSVTSNRISTRTIYGDKFAPGTLTQTNLLDGAITPNHITNGQIIAAKIDGTLDPSVFASNSITGGRIAANSLTHDRLVSWSFDGLLLQDKTLVTSKFQNGSVTEGNITYLGMNTSDFADQSVTDAHLQDFIIESSHVKDNSLTAGDLMTRSLPGDKFITGTIWSMNVLNQNITTNHIADYGISGSLFDDKSIKSLNLSTAFLQKDMVKAQSLSGGSLQLRAVKESHLATHFNIHGDSIAANAFGTTHIADKAIRPKHFALNTITSEKLGQLKGEDFIPRSVDVDRLQNGSVEGTKIASDTFFDINHSLIILKDDGEMDRVTRRDTTNTTWGTKHITGMATDTRMSFIPDGSASKFSFTSGTKLYTANTSDGGAVTEVYDFSNRFSKRTGNQVVTFNNKLYTIGGLDNGSYLNDVWVSTDGVVWERLTTNAFSTGAHAFGEAVVLNNKIWYLGGNIGASNPTNEIWSSSDGITWTLEVSDDATWSNYGESEYKLAAADEWANVRSTCTVQSAELVSIHDSTEQNYIYTNYCNSAHCYLGINDNSTNTVWVWSDNSGVKYSNWAGGQPEDNSEHCGVLDSNDGTWHDYPCDFSFQSVCRRDFSHWSPRWNFSAVVHDGEIWVMGGTTNYGTLNDLWHSADGINWTRETGEESTTVLLSHFDENDSNVVDVSAQNHPITIHSTPRNSTAQSKFGGKSFGFDGTDDSISIPDSEDWNFGASNFTIEFFIFPLATDDNDCILSQYIGDADRWRIHFLSNQLRFHWRDGGTNYVNLYSGISISTGSWHHVAISRIGKFFYMFIDGLLRATNTTTVTLNNFSAPLYIGSQNGTGGFFQGYIDELRIIKGAGINYSITPVPTQPHGIPWAKRSGLEAVADGSNILFTGGRDGGTHFSDFWTTNTKGRDWTKKPDHPCPAVANHVMFPIGVNYAMGAGWDGSGYRNKFCVTDGNNWITGPTDAPFGGREFVDGSVLNGQYFLIGGHAGGSNQNNEVWHTSNGTTWANAEPTQVVANHWKDTNDFLVTVKNTAGLYGYHRYNGGTFSSTPSDTRLMDMSCNSAGQCVGVTLDGTLLYSTDFTFASTTIILSNEFSYSSPTLSPANDYVYAIKHIAGGEQMVRIPWDGNTGFSEEENLNPAFAQNNISISHFDLTTDATQIYFVTNITGANKLHRISVDGTGLTTFDLPSSTAARGAIKVLPGLIYNPFIPNNTIVSDHVKDRSLDGSLLASETLKTEDFAFGGLGSGVISTGSLYNINFARGSITQEKWNTGAINNRIVGDNVVESDNILDGEIANRLIKDKGLTGRVFGASQFTNTELVGNTIQARNNAPEGFVRADLDTDLDSMDIHAGALMGSHFSALTSAVIEDDSISTNKLITTGIFGKTHFADNTVTQRNYKENALPSAIFNINQFEGNLLENESITTNKIMDASINTTDIGDLAIFTTNIKNNMVITRHFAKDSIITAHLNNALINSRTLTSSSITSGLIGENALTHNQFTANAVINRTVSTSTLGSNKLSDAVFLKSHFANDTITGTATIQDGTIDVQRLPFSTTNESKLAGAVSLSTSYLVSGSYQGSGLNALNGNHVLNGTLKDEHFITDTFTTNELGNDITSDKIADYSMQQRHFADNSLDQNSFANGSVSFGKVKTNTIQNDKVTNATIPGSKFDDLSITDIKIKNNDLENDRLVNDAIENTNIKNWSLDSSNFADNSVQTNKIPNQEILGTSVKDSSIITVNLALTDFISSDFSTNVVTNSHFVSDSLKANDLRGNDFGGGVFADNTIDGSSFTDNTITNSKLADFAVTGSNIPGNLTASEIALDTIESRHIDTDLVDLDIEDGTFPGYVIASGTITGGKIKGSTLSKDAFENQAFNTIDINTSVDITGKVSPYAEIASIKIKNYEISGNHLSGTINATNNSVLQNNVLTDGNLNATPNITAGKIKDASLIGDNISNDQLSAFSSNSLTSELFSTSSFGGSSKISDSSIFGYHFLTGVINNTKIKNQISGNTFVDNILGSEDFSAGSISGETIIDNSLTSGKMPDGVINNTSYLTSFSASKLEAVTGKHLANDVFSDSHFGVNFFKSAHLGQFDGDRFADEVIYPQNIEKYTFKASDFANDSLNGDIIAKETFTTSQISAGALTDGNLQNSSIVHSHFDTKAITYSNIQSNTWDNLFGQQDLGTGVHSHSPIAYNRQSDAGWSEVTNYTNKGRTQFLYKTLGPDTYLNAQNTCNTENAMVCDTEQLQQICEKGGSIAADTYYFSGNPTFINELAKEYAVIPMMNLSGANCYQPTSVAYDFLNYQLTPVLTNPSSNNNVRDLIYHKGRYFSKHNYNLYSSLNNYHTDAKRIVSGAQGDASLFSHFTYNTAGDLFLYSDDYILKLNGTYDGFDQNAHNFGSLIDIDGYKSGSNNIIFAGNSGANYDGDYWVGVVSFDNTYHKSYNVSSRHELKRVQPRVDHGTHHSGYVAAYNTQSWLEVASGAAESANKWSARNGQATTVFNNEVWMVGGHDGSYKNDIWHTSNPSENWTKIAATDDDKTNLLLHFNNANDSSGNNLNFTNTSVTFTNTAPTKFSNYANFNGSAYLTHANNTNFALEGNNFTVDFWIYRSASDGDKTIFANYNNNNNRWHLFLDGTDGKLFLFKRVSNTTTMNDSNSKWNKILNTNTWYHVALVKIGTQFTLFVNGNNEGTIDHGQDFTNVSGTFYIGYNFVGRLDEFRLSKGVVRWTENFTPPTTDFVDAPWNTRFCATVTSFNNKLYHIGGTDDTNDTFNDVWSSSDGTNWTHQSLNTETSFQDETMLLMNGEALSDSSSNNHTISNNNASVESTQTMAGFGNAMYFDGGNDWFTVGENSDFNFGTNDFTIEFWLYPNSTTDCCAMGKRKDASNAWYFDYWSGNFYLYTSTGMRLNWSGSLQTGTWQHITLVRSGNNFTVYVNGISMGTVTDSRSMPNITDRQLEVGRMNWFDDNSQYYDINGYMDELRISNVAKYNSNFVVQPKPYKLHFKPRQRHQTLSYNNKLWVMGGFDGDSTYFNDVWSSSNGSDWTFEGNAPWTARADFATTIYDNKIWIIGGSQGLTPQYNDAWWSTDGSNWTQATAAGPWTNGMGLQASVVKDPRNNEDTIYLVGGQKSQEVFSSTDGSNWEQMANGEWPGGFEPSIFSYNDKLYRMAGYGDTKTNSVWQLEFPWTGTHVDYFEFEDGGNNHFREDSYKISDTDTFLHLHCPVTEHCYASTSNNGVKYFYANGTGMDPGFTVPAANLSAHVGGSDINNLDIVHMNSSINDGTPYLYLLDTNRNLYRMRINADGSPIGGATIDQVPTGLTPTGAASVDRYRIYLKNRTNEEIAITGIDDHIVVLKEKQQANFGCCRQTLK
jgi:hypothetical protein